MLRKRLIPVLLLKDGGVVKTTKFKDESYVGDPINIVKIFNEKEVDELIILDIEATKEKRAPNFKLLKDIASEAFMPISYGGGLNNLEDVKKIFNSGIEKVIINSNNFVELDLIERISNIYGNQSVVGSIDVKKSLFNGYRIFSHSGIKKHKIEINEFVNKLIKKGVGELFINSINMDGTMLGLDYKLLEILDKEIDVPLVLCGGLGSVDHIHEAYSLGVDAVAGGSFFIYNGPHKAVLISYPKL